MTWLMRPIQLPAAAIASNSGGVGLPIANLLSPQPKQVFALAIEAAWSLAISVDLGADTAIDTLAMLFHNGDAAGGWRAYYRTAAQGPAPGHFDDTGSTLWFALTSWRLASVVSPAPARRHALHAGEAVTARYLKIYMVSPAGANPAWFVGCLAVGKRIEPGRATNEMRGFDWGAGRRVIDPSEKRVLDGGERSTWRRAKLGEVRGTFSHLTDAEREELFALEMLVGETEAVLLCEAIDTLGAANAHERLHYGTLVGLDFFGRIQANKHQTEVRVLDWL